MWSDCPNFVVFANSNVITIDSPCDAQISIYDLNGRLILTRDVDEGITQVLMQQKGLFFVKLTGSNTQVTEKVFVE